MSDHTHSDGGSDHAFRVTSRTRVKRLGERGHYDRAVVYAILDAGLICHVGYTIDGQPFVTPTGYWRHADRLYWHGSAASRMLRTLTGGVPACVTVTHLDGLVMARSGFNQSMNYRSVMALGTARSVSDAAEKAMALKAFTERVAPGRWDEIRSPTRQELKATSVLWMDLDEVSAKVRSGPPHDDEADYELPIWAGVVPVSFSLGAPEPDPRLAPGVPLSPAVARLHSRGMNRSR